MSFAAAWFMPLREKMGGLQCVGPVPSLGAGMFAGVIGLGLLALFFGAFVAWALGVKGCGVTESLGLGSKHGRGVVW